MAGAYFAPLVVPHTIIKAPGKYRTRSGELVTIDTVSPWHDFRCCGHYSDGVGEGWHRSGRLFANMFSNNDIVYREPAN